MSTPTADCTNTPHHRDRPDLALLDERNLDVIATIAAAVAAVGLAFAVFRPGPLGEIIVRIALSNR